MNGNPTTLYPMSVAAAFAEWQRWSNVADMAGDDDDLVDAATGVADAMVALIAALPVTESADLLLKAQVMLSVSREDDTNDRSCSLAASLVAGLSHTACLVAA